jgi:hypothetical protein
MSRSTVFDELTLTLDESVPTAVRVDLKGRSNSREPGRVLLPWFRDVLRRTSSVGGRLEVHFEQLEHFNSSTISALIQIINAAHAEKVPLVLSYDDSLRWQTLSFDALKRALRPFDGGTAHPHVTFVTAHR